MNRQNRGAASVELALVLGVFVALVLALVEFSKWMFALGDAVEATRLGARLAAVCAREDADWVRRRMIAQMPRLAETSIDIRYPAPGCSAQSCEPVTVRLVDVSVSLGWPLSMRVALPPFSTALPAESLDSTDNALCR